MQVNFPIFLIVKEMVMAECVRVKQVHIDYIVINKGASDKRLWKIVDRHCIIINIEYIIDIKLFLFNLFLSSLFRAKSPYVELSII